MLLRCYDFSYAGQLTLHELTQRIKDQALAVGFDLVGVAPVQESPELAFFERWLEAGYAGEMHYLERSRERRRDLQQVLPGAQSVVVCGLNYDTDYPYSTAVTDPNRGWIARYAWGADYHQAIQDKLAQLQAFVAPLVPPTVASKLYVDTGPVVERVYAKYAGLGWFGKNTCLLNTRLGSWLLLGETHPDYPPGIRPSGARPLRHMYPLPGGLSDASDSRALRAGCAALYRVSDNRTQRHYSRGIACANWPPHLWV